MPSLHGLEGEGRAAAKHAVLVPAAASVHTGQEAQGASCIRHATSGVDLAREECHSNRSRPHKLAVTAACGWRTTREP